MRRPRNFKHVQKEHQEKLKAEEEVKAAAKAAEEQPRKRQKKNGKAAATAAAAPSQLAENEEGEERAVEDLDYADAMAAGLAFEQLSSTEGAIVAFQTALKHKPDCVEALSHLGDLEVQEEEHEQAIELFQRATAQSPQDASLWFRLAVSLEATDKHDDAIEAYKKSLEVSRAAVDECEDDEERRGLAKAWSMGLAALANCFGMKGDMAGAVQVYRDAVAKDGKNGNLHYNLATMLVVLDTEESKTEAIKSYEQAIACAPSTRAFYEDLVALLAADKKKHAKKLKAVRAQLDKLPVEEDESVSDE
ncbi:TPA: hypothetical protein N0F65_006915 [Lagenidium giganteum]|uniref:Uncharacterized protein n=1 Tax=Lagenidium giganteum TaxID=4803 RepID=A0AAV2ZD22_9STRA|nr:TPA: hypothetical protein N0F65_006915 [Lagenidium giganteum]